MNKYYLIIAFLILIFISVFIGSFFVMASESVDINEDVLLYQKEIEGKWASYGYTIDNPNIILNPYGLSPLTALVIFETDDYVSPNIKIVGKTENTTFTYTLNENKIHYLPIYYLYSNYENKVIISYNNVSKEIVIVTDSIEEEFDTSNVVNNDLLFINNNVSYAYDKNKDIRWYIDNNYQGKVTMLSNNHLLVGSNKLNENTKSISLLEIDLLGKIYYEYLLNNEYNFLNKVIDNNIYINNNTIINRQSGIITTEEDNEEVLVNNDILINYNLYFELKDGIKIGELPITKITKKRIILLNSSKIKDDDVEIYQEEERLVIKTNYQEDDRVYLILDKYLDKKVYEIDSGIKYINNTSLNGKYSLYLKVNDNLYKLDKYVVF